jgi:hypothetical protein
MVYLDMPTTGYMAELGKVPYPQIRFPMSGGDSIFITQKYPKETDEYDSVDVRGYLKLVDYQERNITYGNQDKIVKTWTIEAYNMDNPKYRALYKFTSNYGFNYFKYYLDGKEIEINHYSTTHTDY